jgi:hypothetical protein
VLFTSITSSWSRFSGTSVERQLALLVVSWETADASGHAYDSFHENKGHSGSLQVIRLFYTNSSGRLSAFSIFPLGLQMYMAITVRPYLRLRIPTMVVDSPWNTCGMSPQSSTGYSTKTMVSSVVTGEFATASSKSPYTTSS